MTITSVPLAVFFALVERFISALSLFFVLSVV